MPETPLLVFGGVALMIAVVLFGLSVGPAFHFPESPTEEEQKETDYVILLFAGIALVLGLLSLALSQLH